MDRERADAVSFATRIERDGEERVGRLGLTVGDPLVVGTSLELRIVEVERGARMATRRQCDDASSSRPPERWPEPRGELEVPEVIGRQLRLAAERRGGGDDARARRRRIRSRRTPLWNPIPETEREALFRNRGGKLLTGRVGEAPEIAEAYCFLMENEFMTGQTVVVDGGGVLI
jgi:hypothetical protein